MLIVGLTTGSGQAPDGESQFVADGGVEGSFSTSDSVFDSEN